MADLQSALDAPVKSSRWTVLAGARFVLAWVVLTDHIQTLGIAKNWFTWLGDHLNASSAVYGFLIISGYSIAASLDRAGRGFYGRRFWRIFPTYFASILLAIVASYFITGSLTTPAGISYYPVTAVGVVTALVMMQSFIGPTISTDGQLWTLAVEWWLYMLAPIFRRCASIILVLLLIPSLYAFTHWQISGRPELMTHGFMFTVLAWSWLSGFLYYRHRGTPWGAMALFFPAMFALVHMDLGRGALFAIAALAVCDVMKVPKQCARFVNWLGELSYPMYAVHVPIIVLCLALHIHAAAVIFVAVMGASVAVLHVVDLPLRKWGAGLKRKKPRTAFAGGASQRATSGEKRSSVSTD